jgi:hypothetical protein
MTQEAQTKLTDRQKGFIALLNRSPDQGEGWRTVSNVLWGIAKKHADDAPELFEADDEASRIRLTAKGAVVSEYLV